MGFSVFPLWNFVKKFHIWFPYGFILGIYHALFCSAFLERLCRNGHAQNNGASHFVHCYVVVFYCHLVLLQVLSMMNSCPLSTKNSYPPSTTNSYVMDWTLNPHLVLCVDTPLEHSDSRLSFVVCFCTSV